jgi:hypothetical protein
MIALLRINRSKNGKMLINGFEKGNLVENNKRS